MRSEFSGSFIKLLIFAAVLITIINDGGNVLMGYYRLGDESERVAREALRFYQLYGNDINQARQGAQDKAAYTGSVLTNFQIINNNIHVEIEIPPKSTWVIQRIPSLKPYLNAKGSYDLPISN